MPAYNGNNVYLMVNGQDYGGWWRELDVRFANANIDGTAGSGVKAEQNLAGLDNYQATLTIICDSEQAAAQYYNLVQSDRTLLIDYGKQGNGAGKPRHHQLWKLSDTGGQEPRYDKPLNTIEVQLVGADEPIVNQFEGGTFS